MRRGGKILSILVILCLLLYLAIGVFGYLTFVDRPEILKKGNILVGDYKNTLPITIVIIK